MYEKLWDLQTREGLKFKGEYPNAPLSEVHILLEALFEEHREQAFAEILKRPNDTENKRTAKIFMIKAFLTFGSSKDLAGYANGGKSW